ncbi:MAG: hypothetical protein IK120_07695 [Muribaculaceae bacterium]|nr:hypothetical protein [Muribaculaceae bacterium]
MKTPVTFSLSAQSIVNQALALSALRRAIGKPTDEGLLTSDKMSALRMVAKAAFAEIVLRLMRHVGDASINNEGPQPVTVNDESLLLTVALYLPADVTSAEQGVVRRLLEHATTMLTLSMAYSAADNATAEHYRGLAESSADRLSAVLKSSDEIPSSFALCWL